MTFEPSRSGVAVASPPRDETEQIEAKMWLAPPPHRGARRMSPVRLAIAFVLTFAVGAVAGGVSAQARPRMWAEALVDTTTDDLRWARTKVRVNLDHWDPGGETGLHRHPGPTVIYVLEGDLQEVFADGKTLTLKAGHAFWNRARTSHNVRNVSANPASAVAVHLDPGR